MKQNNERRFFMKKIIYTTLLFYIGILFNNNCLEKDIIFINEEFNAMGTDGKMQIYSDNKDYDMSLTVAEAVKRMHEIDALASKFKMFSDISIINKNPNNYNKVSDDIITLAELSNQYLKKTNGFFDVGIGNFLTLSGIDNNIPLVGKNFFSKSLYNKELIKIKNNKIKLLRENSMLDFGGIAKGYAIDEAMKILIKNGVKHAAIEFGGDIKVYGGMPNNQDWTIIVNNGLYNEFFKIKNGSISVSNGSIKKSMYNINNITHHIINPKTLSSNNNYISTLVMGESCTICDVLSTACYNMTENEIFILKKYFPNYYFKTYI